MKISSSHLQSSVGRFYQRSEELTMGRESNRGSGTDQVSLSRSGRRSSSLKVGMFSTRSNIREANGHKYSIKQLHLYESHEDKVRISNFSRSADTINTASDSGQTIITTNSRKIKEEESLSFMSTGTITLINGRRVEFSLEMLMQRQFELEEARAFSQNFGLTDPLVINFSGATATLSDNKYQFDLNSDGLMDNISFVGSGSGFLALDKNKDGSINNGSELFGPNVGNGYDELKAYDQDGNNWIDENDPIYGKLKVWSKDSAGQDKLQSLSELGIGAISLDTVATQFSITNHNNNLQGMVQRTSVIVKEDGTVQTMQQIDLRSRATLTLGDMLKQRLVDSMPILSASVKDAQGIDMPDPGIDELQVQISEYFQNVQREQQAMFEQAEESIKAYNLNFMDQLKEMVGIKMNKSHR